MFLQVQVKSASHRIPSPCKMTVVFSFCLYGDQPTYTHGMLANARMLNTRFPEARVQIYIADDVPPMIRAELAAQPNVRLVLVPRRPASGNMMDRFRAIDDEDCEVMFVRDADSRVHARDAACIEDFLASPTHKLHIIRDHKYHTEPIMGGLWGFRKQAAPLTPPIERWLSSGNTAYMSDQYFLRQFIYPVYCKDAIIHDRYHRFEPPERHTPFRVPIEGRLFVGQTHKISETGEETLVYDP